VNGSLMKMKPARVFGILSVAIMAGLLTAAWTKSELSYSRTVAAHPLFPSQIIQRVPDYWGRRVVPCDSVQIVNDKWMAEMKWPVRMLLGSNQLLVVEGEVFAPGDTLIFAYDTRYWGMTINGNLPLDSRTQNPSQTVPGEQGQASEKNARERVCFYKGQVESGIGFIEVSNWLGSSSRSATESEVARALGILDHIESGVLSDDERSAAQDLGLWEVFISDVAGRAQSRRR
jgi:hypothetical protein